MNKTKLTAFLTCAVLDYQRNDILSLPKDAQISWAMERMSGKFIDATELQAKHLILFCLGDTDNAFHKALNP